MANLQSITDKTAIGFSLLCALHCLALPLIVVLIPSLASLPLQNETLHLWMLVAVIPASAYALTMGCKQHQRYQLFATGFIGLTCLIIAVAFAETYGELWEKSLTLIGASIITFAHVINYRLYQSQTKQSRQQHEHS